MFQHRFYKCSKEFIDSKKNIFLIIKKQPGEVDWILPVLNDIKKKFNIIVIFEKKISIELLKQNELLYEIFLKTVCGYFVNSPFKCLPDRLLFKISVLSNLKKFAQIYQMKIFNKYYNVDDLLNTLQKNNIYLPINKIRILMQDFTDNSPWIKKLSHHANDSKIILYPHTTSIFSSKKNKKKIINKKLNRNNLFLSSCKDLSYFKNKFNKHNIYICG